MCVTAAAVRMTDPQRLRPFSLTLAKSMVSCCPEDLQTAAERMDLHLTETKNHLHPHHGHVKIRTSKKHRFLHQVWLSVFLTVQ